MEDRVPCPFAVDEGAACLDTIDVPGRVRNTLQLTPDELHEDVVASLQAYEVTTCDLCHEEYTVEYYPE